MSRPGRFALNGPSQKRWKQRGTVLCKTAGSEGSRPIETLCSTLSTCLTSPQRPGRPAAYDTCKKLNINIILFRKAMDVRCFSAENDKLRVDSCRFDVKSGLPAATCSFWTVIYMAPACVAPPLGLQIQAWLAWKGVQAMGRGSPGAWSTERCGHAILALVRADPVAAAPPVWRPGPPRAARCPAGSAPAWCA